MAHIQALVAEVAPANGHALRCVSDHRRLQAGDIWFAWPGKRFDPRSVLVDCAALGVRAVIAESNGLSPDWLAQAQTLKCPVYLVSGLVAQAGQMAAVLSGNTSGQSRLIAVTGTNGKTSVTRWISQCLDYLQERCAVIGTLGAGFVDEDVVSTGLTTPDAVSLQAAIADLRTQGARTIALESSSIGLEQGRLNGCHFDVAAFTNLSRDHLDYHADMQSYEAAKQLLMAWPALRHAVVNMDDPAGERFLRTAESTGAQLIQVASNASRFVPDAGTCLLLRATHVSGGMKVQLNAGAQSVSAAVAVIGQFNLENVAVVAGVLLACAYSLEDIAAALPAISSPPGRMQVVPAAAGPLVVVDYAHTPDALDKVLKSLRPVVSARGGALHCVFGCGGDRDPGKRPLMAAVAEQLADHVVVTSDNPRSESADQIIKDIIRGLKNPDRASVLPDRAAAIAASIGQAGAADLVLLAGKGHETGQTIGDVVLPFSDLEHARSALSAWASAHGEGA
jgi:UDP-N-acetylmuramyl-tripeptide synthetase